MSIKTVKAVLAELFEKEEFFQAISDGVEKKLGTILDRLVQQEACITEFVSTGKVRDAQIRDLETKLSSMETRCDKLESDLMGVQNGKDQQDQQLKSLQKELNSRNEEAHSLKRSINSLEQYTRVETVYAFLESRKHRKKIQMKSFMVSHGKWESPSTRVTSIAVTV